MRPAYLLAGLRASGTASDLRRLRLAAMRVSSAKNEPEASTPRQGKLRVLAHVPRYPPESLGGAESSIRAILEFLSRRGHEVVAVVEQSDIDCSTIEQVKVLGSPSRRRRRDLYRWADVVLTQTASSIRAFMLAASHGKPVAVFVRDVADWQRLPADPSLLVFNAQWQRDLFRYEGRSLVLHPPIDPDLYRTTRGVKVTMINLNERKGGELFLDIVRRMPDVDFLGVTGMWGNQLLPDPIPPNLMLMPSVSDAREVYALTSILLLPSKWETFGRVAVEAALSGIPVVASPNPGSFEALGNSAIYAPLSAPDEWVLAIRSLQDEHNYQLASDAVTRVAGGLDSQKELSLLEIELMDLAAWASRKKVIAE